MINLIPPCFRQMLQDGLALIGLDPLRHHIDNIVHDRRAQLEIVMRLDALLRNRLGDTLRVSSFEMSREQVSEPSLEQRHNAAHEKEPHAPPRRPNPNARALAHWPCVESPYIRGK
ncbi:hypothetical protein BC937DRAFT_90706 [Endogone sp. FLAS-F59071]|nr:hypothetical protein BC937DRAFT_90706 [Endogone sp. FLAS-F59071]|eukprot:RUS16871.1 hypothetical protein BC937DRAFT_90706 [Endogone sp. FLAS-F59071]